MKWRFVLAGAIIKISTDRNLNTLWAETFAEGLVCVAWMGAICRRLCKSWLTLPIGPWSYESPVASICGKRAYLMTQALNGYEERSGEVLALATIVALEGSVQNDL